MTATTPFDADRQRRLDAARRPPFYRDVRILTWTFQLAVFAAVIAVVAWLYDNVQVNSDRQNIPTSFDYLDQPAGFPIFGSDFRQTQPVSDALVRGLAQHPAPGSDRHRAGDRPRDAARHRPPVEELPRCARPPRRTSRSSATSRCTASSSCSTRPSCSTPSPRRTSRGRSVRSPCSTSAARASSGSTVATRSSS